MNAGIFIIVSANQTASNDFKENRPNFSQLLIVKYGL